MHIGIVALDYPSRRGGGGVGHQAQTVGRALVRAGHDVTVIALNGPGVDAHEVDQGVNIRRIQRGHLHWYLSRVPVIGGMVSRAARELEDGWVTFRLLRALHRRHPFDVLEITETGGLGACYLGRGHLGRIPLVARLHGEVYTYRRHTPTLALTIDVRLARALQRVALRRSDRLTAPSRAHAREIARELRVPARSRRPPIQVIPNAVPDCAEVRTDAGRESPGGENELVVLFVGRLEPVKGIAQLLAAARLVIQAVPEAVFVLAGAAHPTMSRVQIDRLIRTHQLTSSNLQILGHIPTSELNHWYARSSLVVIPSMYESFGIVALEAMQAALPVVATTAGGLPEVIEAGTTGILVPPGDVSRLANAMIQLLRDPDLRNRLGTAGRERASTMFGVDKTVEQMLHVYRDAANGR